MLVYALIPARSGSKGLPNKNVLEVDGHPLLAYAIAFGRRVGCDRVIVSTDSAAYRTISLQYGAECPYLRRAHASGDTSREEDVLADLAENLVRVSIPVPDIWVWLKPVNPFRSLEAVQHGLALIKTRSDLDSVRIVSEADARLHRVNEDGYLEPYGPGWDASVSKMPRVRFPKVYQPYNLEIFRQRLFVERGASFMGRKIAAIVAPKITGFDIDDQETFDIVKALIEMRPRPEFVARHIHL